MPRRLVKQLIYGFFYLSLIGSIFLIFYFAFLKPAPSCFNNKLDQNETAVDCGGVCAPCELAKVQPVQVNWVKYFPASQNRITIAAELANPNTNFASPAIPYRFTIYGPFGVKIKTLENNTFIYAGERKYLLESAAFDFKDITRIDLDLGESQWLEKTKLIKPSAEPVGIRTEIKDSFISVSGSVSNKQAAALRQIKVIVFLFDRFKQILMISQTVVNDIGGFKEKAFNLALPAGVLGDKVAPDQTRIFLEIKPSS
ncbi:MAG: hypothetical protein HYW34_03445 [Candidatus Brennerbacteria bacterium]|nr:hypothetical protein [Candidatus Brennerbacteria bacterium]